VNERERTRRSRFLSLVLRHEPEKIGLMLDDAGWVSVDSLLGQLEAHGKRMSRTVLEEIVATSPKQRFALSEDGLRIRANQGHSVSVELGYVAMKPPAQLFHGTVADALCAIEQQGLSKMNRHHVHLSPDPETATKVAQRRGRAIVLVVDAGRMSGEGFAFYRSENGVWLTSAVPREFLIVPDY
jgi:putative RNA 2'-phosphotransferase